MSNLAARRYGGRAVWAFARRTRNGAALAIFLTALPPCRPAAAFAQVGHTPDRSPFRDIATRQHLGFVVGRFLGNEAKAGVGAQAATAYGIRFRNRLSGPLDFTFGASYIASTRLLVDPTRPDSVRRSGPVNAGLISAEVGLSLTLTGAKTWHGLAPWVGIGIGLISATSPTTDPGGFSYGTNFTLVPMMGTSLRLSERLTLEFEARNNTIRYEWPLSYFDPRDANNNQLPPPVLATGEKNRQVTHNFTLSVGVSYHFNF